MVRNVWRPDLSDPQVRARLAPRDSPYFELVSYCRHLGLQVSLKGPSHWVGRVRRKDGQYTQQRLGPAEGGGFKGLTYRDARMLAEDWFHSHKIQSIASEPYALGSNRNLNICPIGDDYTVGHALARYVEWKRLAAAQTTFEASISLINYHLVPRLSFVLLEEFNGSHYHDLAMEVIETPPKYGRKLPGARVPISQLPDETLRKRKKTLNALVSILRGAFQIAWEHNMLESDRPMRCLRRVPNVDRPRVVFLDREECRGLLDASHPDLRSLILGGLYTGCRATELTRLLVGDVDLHSGSIHISSSKNRRSRHVYLPTEGITFFRGLVEGKLGNDRVFRKASGRAWGGEYRTYFQAARSRAGLPSAVSFHGLRHTYASQLVQAGTSLMVIAEQLGHANTQTVSSTYGHLISRHRAEEIDARFEPLLSRGDASVKARRPSSAGNPRHLEIKDVGSWPRANHSRYSGPALETLSNRRNIDSD